MPALYPNTTWPATRRTSDRATGQATDRPTYRPRKTCMTRAKPTVDNADWELLFQAVLARLTRAVAAPPGARQDLAAAMAAAHQVQATVLECVEALAQLQTSRQPGAEPQRHTPQVEPPQHRK